MISELYISHRKERSNCSTFMHTHTFYRNTDVGIKAPQQEYTW
jgi:hypothetical protein